MKSPLTKILATETTVRCLLFTAFSVLFACSSSADQDGHSFLTYREGDITIVESKGGPKYSDWLFTFQEILRLDQDPAVEASLLFRPDRFTRGPDGHYYVIDAGNRRVAVFNEDGMYERCFGEEGEGPGTFRSMAFQGLHDGILHIRDSRLNRTTLMRLDGSLVDVLVRPRVAAGVERYRLPGSRQLLLQRPTRFTEHSALQNSEAIIVDAALDTVAFAATDPVRIAVGIFLSEGQTWYYAPTFYPGFPWAAYEPQVGILLTDGLSPLIWKYNGDGELVEKILLDISPPPVTEEERERILSELDEDVRESSTASRRAVSIARRDNLTVPEFKGYWESVTIDDAGYVWLEVVEDDQTRRQQGGGTLCDVVSPRGEYLGRSRLPDHLLDSVIADGILCAFTRVEETGEEIPTVFRMLPAAEGLKYP